MHKNNLQFSYTEIYKIWLIQFDIIRNYLVMIFFGEIIFDIVAGKSWVCKVN